jgi:hypothetical protein
MGQFAMPFVKSSVGGCNKKLQPILKVDLRDRATWIYREYDTCLRTACEKHSAEIDGQIFCDCCRREVEGRPRLIVLETRSPSSSPCQAPPGHWGEEV